MFRRLILEDSTTLFTLFAFIVAASIFITFVWRAIRMSRRQCEHFENLPFETPTPESVALRVSAGTSETDETPESRRPFDKLRAPSLSRGSRGGLQESSDDES